MAYDYRKFYIDGQWVAPAVGREKEVINPATEEPVGTISVGSVQDVDRAVAAARRAFETFSQTTADQRRALLETVLAVYKDRHRDIARAIREEMGAPEKLATRGQAAIGVGHLTAMIEVLRKFSFEEHQGSMRLIHEPVGVCALITPWNWPINQLAAKVVPALAAGCTMVLKPADQSPFSAMIWAEVMHEAGVPAGVFNLVTGSGTTVGTALASHPDVDMVSFTGSTRAGTEVARLAAASVKRVHLELGGKCPSILFDDADFPRAVKSTVRHVFENSGQSCNAPTRMLVPAARLTEVEELAKQITEKIKLGDPASVETDLGPVVSKSQLDSINGYIAKGMAEGAKLVIGGEGRPEGLTKGYYVKPTIFSNVDSRMTIAREEIFGPVLSILPYRDEEDAIRIANDSPYGLQAYVWSGDVERANRIGARIRAGRISINGSQGDMHTPFGGFKQSGYGREWGEHGLREFLELKAVLGAEVA